MAAPGLSPPTRSGEEAVLERCVRDRALAHGLENVEAERYW